MLGGIIPETDIEPLKAQGVREVFLPGTPMLEAVEAVRKLVPQAL